MVRIKVTSQEDQDKFVIISCSVLLRMKNVSDKILLKIKTHMVGWVTVFPGSSSVNEMMWKKFCRAG